MKILPLKKTLTVLVLGSLSLVTAGAQANWEHDGRDGNTYDRHAYQQSRMFSQQINLRQNRQLQRIQAGVHDGRLTRSEFRRLIHGQHDIRAMEHAFRADGMIDAREFRRLDRALDVADRTIRAEKRDRQERYADRRSPRHH